MAFTKINAAGIGTTETVTVDGLTVINDGSFGGNLSVGGTITYEDVTNVDSVGIITARAGVLVGSGITLSKDGDVFFTGIPTGNGSGLTALNASNLASGTVPTARLGSGTASSSTFLRGDSTFQTVNTDLVSDTSPQLGGTLDLNGQLILAPDSTGAGNNRIKVGAGGDLALYHDGTDSYMSNANGDLYINNVGASSDDIIIKSKDDIYIMPQNGEYGISVLGDGACELYHNNSKKLNTNSGGVDITGHAYFPDNNGTHFGAGEDFKIYHDGTSNIFQSNGLKNFIFRPKDTDVGLKIIGDGGVELYYDNGVRLQTTTNGVTAGTPDTSQTAVVGAQAGFFGGAKSLFASATGLIQNQVCILDTATSAAAGTGGALTFAGYIDNDSTTYYATIEGVKANSSTNNYDGNLKFLTRAHNVANMNEAMIIDSSGNVMINQTTALAKLTVAATWSQAPISCDTTSSNASAAQINFRFNNSSVGNIVSTSSNTAYNTSSSDRALKKNFEDWNENTLDLFKSLKPQKFHFLTDEDSDPKSKGYIAQDLVDSFPEAYPLNPQTDKYDFNPSGMVTYLMKALQEEIVKREALEARIAALEG